MHSVNKVDENIAKIGALFPNCVTERKNENGEVEYAVDFDMLKQELSSIVVEGNEERYQFTWPDKKKSILLANAPIAKTLRPCCEESVDFDTTENLYIEGDNLEALKLLQETYLGKIKMVYIDPPYNTGSDFVYEDDFAQSADEYLAHSGQYDEEGNRLVANTESNGRYHTDWLNMIYPRLKLAKDLLAENGVIFVSIDNHECDNLQKIMSEIFGCDNFIGNIAWRRFNSQANIGMFSTVRDSILVYAKNIKQVKFGRIPLSETAKKEYQYQDGRGVYARRPCIDAVRGRHSFDVKLPNGNILRDHWMMTEEEFRQADQQGLIHWPQNGGNPMRKIYLSDALSSGQIANDFWGSEFGNNKNATEEIKALFGGHRIFDFPKPTKLLVNILGLGSPLSEEHDLILDFFSGSATTAHAVMQLNADDGGKRKFIMVQLPEETDEQSEAYKSGYKNICEIGKERIRRAGAKIKEDNPLGTQNLDTGFRVLKLDSSNMKDVYYNPAEYEMSLFESLADNIKEDRTPEDLLFQIMLDLGVLLSSKIEESTIGGKKVFNVADGFLYACFDANVTEETITEIAKRQPYYFVMRDSSMANDSVATNFDQIFATYSPDTVRKVL